MSLIESFVSTLLGMVIALVAQTWFLGVLGVEISGEQNFALFAFMTLLSVARSYAVRRFFARLHGGSKKHTVVTNKEKAE